MFQGIAARPAYLTLNCAVLVIRPQAQLRHLDWRKLEDILPIQILHVLQFAVSDTPSMHRPVPAILTLEVAGSPALANRAPAHVSAGYRLKYFHKQTSLVRGCSARSVFLVVRSTEIFRQFASKFHVARNDHVPVEGH